MGSIKDYWQTYLWSNALTRLITINFIVWLVVSAVGLVLPHADARYFLELLVLPSVDRFFPARFWTILTYMFVHVDFMHMLVNMMWLLLFGRLFMMMQSGERMVILYIYGGLCGAVGFLVYNGIIAPTHSLALGASCSVLAIVGATALISPGWSIDLMFFGRVKVLWVSLAAVVFLVLFAPDADQMVAHGMGLLAGVAYSTLLRRGVDIARPALQIVVYLRSAFKGNLSMHSQHSINKGYNNNKRNNTKSDHERLDDLLAKVSRSSYSSLTPSERQELFDLSQRLKK